MKIRPVGAKLFHADRRPNRQADRHDEADSRSSLTLRTRLKGHKGKTETMTFARNVDFFFNCVSRTVTRTARYKK